MQRSLFLTPNGLNELPEVRFEFPFNLIGDHDKTKQRPFLTGQPWRVLISSYTTGSPEQGFRRSFADGVNQRFISSARRLVNPLSVLFGHSSSNSMSKALYQSSFVAHLLFQNINLYLLRPFRVVYKVRIIERSVTSRYHGSTISG